ncbi:uncharacterized protein LOC111390945 [Olea europaea var. sylvestris]|uniref:uncharacterized protein LOC111390945 n=1 Tax=Olea europaea var. sylvestris TaxID=158386 RepID=UPI000C1D1ED2|nr:uncharacterized protein LOC111390945 [Olea europaea var. sylvestris]
MAVERIAIVVASAMHSTERDFSIERATKLGAKVFIGTVDPAVAQAWMTKIGKVFDVMSCLDDRKLCLATFLLEEGVYDWWQSVRSTYLDPSIITWTNFHRIFYDAYYPRFYKDAKQEEFLKLVQGQMTVAKYQVKFSELSKLSGREQTIFRASSSQTMASASSYRPLRRDSRGFRLGVSSSSTSQRSFTPRQGESSTSARFSSCQLCGRSHPGECLKFKRVSVCYCYGQEGHLKRNCPVIFWMGGMAHRMFPQQNAGSTRQN